MDTDDAAQAEQGEVGNGTCGEAAADIVKSGSEKSKHEEAFGNTENGDLVDGVIVKVIPDHPVQNGKQSNGNLDAKEGGSEDGSEETDQNGKKKKKKKEKMEMVSYGQLFKYADRKDVLLMVFGSIFAIINGMLQPVSFIVFGELINKFIIDASQDNNVVNGTVIAKTIDIEDEMTTFAAYYCYIAVSMLISAYVQTAFWSLAAIRQAHRIRLSFFNSILTQEIGWFDTTDSGELSTRLVDDVTKVQNGIGDKIGLSIQSVTMFFGGFIIGFVYGWKLTLVILALTPALLVTAGITGKVIGSFTNQEQTAYAKAGSVAEEVLGSIRTVVAFGGEEKELDRYTKHLDAAEAAGVKKGATTGVAFGLFHIVIFSCYALAFWYGSTLVGAGELEGGELLIVFFCVMIGAAQMGQAGPNFEALANARGAACQVIRIIDRKSAIDPVSEEGRKPSHMIGDVDFVKVHFNYPSRPDINILNGLSLSIKSGQTVALVGESGCGKSTTIKLVQRFYDCVEGLVTIDGVDIRDLNVGWLRSHIGVVSQEPLLFDMSITENIRMGNPNASTQDIERAAKDANAHDFIMKLPKHYETNVGEGGAQLSGGQKQRIAIARALVKDPKILLLDEATSALDTESESIVQSALDRASEGRTTIIIAHRLSTVKKADLIAAVQDGIVAEVGTHEELMEKRGVYYQLVMLQTAVEEDDDDDVSILSEEDKEQKMALKYMRTLSTLSAGSENEKEVAKQIEMALHRRLSRKLSAKSNRPESAKSKKKDDGNKEEEEEENIEIPPITRIFKLNAKEWPYLLIGSIFASIVGAFPVVFAIILSEILQSFSFKDTEELKDKARFWALIFLALGFADAVGLLVSSYLFAKAGEVLTKRLRHFAFKAMLRQDIGFFDDPLNSTGALTSRLASDTSGVQGATSSRLSTMVQVIVMGLTALTLAFVYQWKLTLLILAFVPFLAFGGAMQTKMSTSFAAEEKQKMVDAGALATEAIINVRTVASLGREDYFINKYRDLLYVTYKKSKIRAQVYGLSFGSSMAVMMFCNAAAFRLGGYLVARDEVEFDDMFKVVLAIVFGAMIAGQIASFAPDYVKAKISAARLFRLFDTVPRIDSYSDEGAKLDSVEGRVEFRGVKFSYPSRPDVQVLKGFDVKVNPGQTLALVGASGCGKSTSVGLLERFYNVAEGSVLIDGNDIKSLNIKWLRSQIGIVSQEPVLFDCSIRDNIRYGVNDGEREVTQNEIEEAAKAANIHHFISTLPKGYDTEVGDKGTLISGGQKQRIAIARALVRNPRILLLDEATSALDSESEKVVQDALDVAMENRTAIIIAHRLSTIQNADIIAVIQGGCVVEQGTHQELYAKKGAYFLLNEAQM